MFIYPAVHYVMPEDSVERAARTIQAELDERVMQLRHQGKLLEAQRLLARTKYDMEMLHEVGYCSGIENYSRHLNGTPPGAKPYTLIDYFPKDFLLIIDESHVTIPQIGAMYNGDRARKEVLVEHGFRLPSALDNRPMRFEEFEAMWTRCCSCPRRRGVSSWNGAAARWSSRSSGRRGWWIRRSRCGRRRGRCRIC